MIVIKIKDMFRYMILILLFLLLILNIKYDNSSNKTLEVASIDDNFNKDYYDYYLEINYVDNKNFIEQINSLINLGYSAKEINLIYDKLDDEQINLVINSNYDSDITNYFSLNYFIKDNIKRYINFKYDDDKFNYSYFKDNINLELDYKDIVTYVNIGLDKAYYSDFKILSIEESNKIDVLVNKYNKLNENYIADDLELINSKFSLNEQYLRKEANLMFNKMCEDASLLGYKIYAGSSYRSYAYQNELYNNYVLKDSFINAETYSARAGFSEHQTGLAVDILNEKWQYLNEEDIEYKWLIDNSYKYGFILRYPKDKEIITGYIYEPWHFRYITKDIAKILYNDNITYEEYVAKKQAN